MKKRAFETVNQVIKYYAESSPSTAAMLQFEDNKKLTYKQFSKLIDFFALRLIDAGLTKGDVVATQLVLVPEHVILMYACFKIGVIIAPLDLRLKPDEVVRDINKIQPKMFFFLGETPVMDFREVGKAVQKDCPSVTQLVQFLPPEESSKAISGALAISDFLNKPKLLWLKIKSFLKGDLRNRSSQISKRTPALIIYTTGTTGEPKPALLCHENILVQNEVLSRGIGKTKNPLTTMVNLPPSHVGCVTETLMTTFYRGGKTILLRIFDVENTLAAIEKYRINLLGQIPTQFRMLWASPNYSKFDLSSLESVVYAGSAGDLPFLKQLAEMAPNIGTGLGMTENAGFATFSRPGATPESLVGQVGCPFPDLAKVSIRSPMKEDGTAGEELLQGDTGEICYHPPIVFLGYFNNEDETRKAVSREGLLYTGDLGRFEMVDGEPALFLSGRRKFVIKQKGYNVFPTEVEEFLVSLDGVEQAEVVGVKHQMFDEGIFAFVKVKDGQSLDTCELLKACGSIAAYKRPQHIEVWQAGDFPINRSTKVDKLALQSEALKIVERLRAKGEWDAKH